MSHETGELHKLYDSYLRAFRWATDRVLSSTDGGIVAYVTNNSFLDSNMADGVRLSLADEYHHIYVYNLRGNQKAADWRAEGGKVFGSGSQAGIAVTVLVKMPGETPRSGAQLHYFEVADGLSREEKLEALKTHAEATGSPVAWTRIAPNLHGDWVTQRSADLESLIRIQDDTELSVFRERTLGLFTGRDVWNHSFSLGRLRDQAAAMIDFFNFESQRVSKELAESTGLRAAEKKRLAKESVDLDSSKFKWIDGDFGRAAKGVQYSFDESDLRTTIYRPFTKQYVNFAKDLNARVLKLPRVFPSDDSSNLMMCLVPHTASKPFSALMVDCIPNLAIWGSEGSVCLPLKLAAPATGRSAQLGILPDGPESNIDPRVAASLNLAGGSEV